MENIVKNITQGQWVVFEWTYYNKTSYLRYFNSEDEAKAFADFCAASYLGQSYIVAEIKDSIRKLHTDL